jgi:hypothetical protein
MLKRLLIILACAPLYSCSLFGEVQEGVYGFRPVELVGEARETLEGFKRDSIQIEDLKIGEGPLATRGRRIEADVEARYLDGALVCKGHIFDYVGFEADTFIHNTRYPRSDRGMLAMNQIGIRLGLNGMAIGGRRRIIIDPTLACGNPRHKVNPDATCNLTLWNRNREGASLVHEKKLLVEATLTASCIPQVIIVPSIASGGRTKEVWDVVVPILPNGSPTIPSGDCINPQTKRG